MMTEFLTFFSFFTSSIVIFLANVTLLFFVIKAIKANIHASLYLVAAGLALSALFSFAARVSTYLATQNYDKVQTYMEISTILTAISFIGFYMKIVGLCVFISVVIKRHLSKEND